MSYSACDFTDDVLSAFVENGLVNRADIPTEDDSQAISAGLVIGAMRKLLQEKARAPMGYVIVNMETARYGIADRMIYETFAAANDAADLMDMESALNVCPLLAPMEPPASRGRP